MPCGPRTAGQQQEDALIDSAKNLQKLQELFESLHKETMSAVRLEQNERARVLGYLTIDVFKTLELFTGARPTPSVSVTPEPSTP